MSTTTAPLSWKQLHGRKTFHKLHPAMLDGDGLVKDLDIRPVPYSADLPKGIYPVVFDRSYAVEKLAYEISDCGNVPFIQLLELLSEAYIIVNPDAPVIGVTALVAKSLKNNCSVDPLALSGVW
jgi:hypothetical protein